MEERSDESSERREGREIEEIYIYVERQRSSAKRVLHDRIEENTGRKVIDDVEDASLLIMNSNLNERIRVSFRGAFPTSLSGIDFTSSVSDMETITATVTFAYTDYDVEVL